MLPCRIFFNSRAEASGECAPAGPSGGTVVCPPGPGKTCCHTQPFECYVIPLTGQPQSVPVPEVSPASMRRTRNISVPSASNALPSLKSETPRGRLSSPRVRANFFAWNIGVFIARLQGAFCLDRVAPPCFPLWIRSAGIGISFSLTA